MERLQMFMRGMPGAGMGGSGVGGDAPTPDCAEKVHVSALSLLKMLKHGRAGVPMEVMGLMLGQFVDDYTINCVDVFAMPQSGTSVSVESVDHVFQQEMLDMLKQTGRPEMVVGWYHSHPGFGCWLSSTDINTQSSFEQLGERVVALVIDPVQSVKGKVVIDCFRLINPSLMMIGQEPRQTTSNIGHLQKPSKRRRRTKWSLALSLVVVVALSSLPLVEAALAAGAGHPRNQQTSSSGRGFAASTPWKVHTTDDSPAIQRLYDFLSSQGARFRETVEVGISSSQQGRRRRRRGLFAMKPIASGKIICQVPSDCALALSNPDATNHHHHQDTIQESRPSFD